MRAALLLLASALTAATGYSAAAGSMEALQGDVQLNDALTADISKLNDYIQQDKENSVHTEALYADLQKRFAALRNEWTRQEAERLATRKALRTAQAASQALARQNEKLTSVLQQFNIEQQRLTKAKSSVLEALSVSESLNLTGILESSV